MYMVYITVYNRIVSYSHNVKFVGNSLYLPYITTKHFSQTHPSLPINFAPHIISIDNNYYL